MQTYISLLRGINVGGQKKIKMAELRDMFQQLGFTGVRTYIQSGNIVFKTKKKPIEKLEDVIKKTIKSTFSFDVPVLVLKPVILKEIIENNPYQEINTEDKSIYFTLLRTVPDPDKKAEVQALEFPGESFKITNRVVYLCVPKGYGKSKLSNNFFEKKLGVQATTRNLRTTHKLLELSKE